MKSLSVKLGVSLAVIIFFLPYNSLAEEDSIQLGGLELKLGMARTLILSELSKQHKINTEKRGSEEICSIAGYDIGKDGEKVYRHMGTIVFLEENGHWVSKSWGTFDNKEANKFVTNFYNLLSNLKSEGKRIAVFNTSSNKQPDYSIESIDFIFGNRAVNILIVESPTSGKTISINETLGRR